MKPHASVLPAIVAASLYLFAALPAAAAEVSSPASKRIEEVNVSGATLDDAFDVLRELTHTNIVVRWPAVEAAGVARTTPVKLRLWDVRLGVALDALLDTAGGDKVPLTWHEDGNVIVVSTEADISQLFRPKVYDVRDLLREMNAAVNTDDVPEEERRTWQEAVDELVRLITEAVDPDSWRDAGGTVGSIREMGGRFVVSQTPEGLRKVERLLNDLRAEFARPPATQPVAAARRGPATSPSAQPRLSQPAVGPARSGPGSPSAARLPGS